MTGINLYRNPNLVFRHFDSSDEEPVSVSSASVSSDSSVDSY
jgi:hypothetical protein